MYDVNDGQKVTRYGYDRIGRVIEVNDLDRRVVKYEYDKMGRRTKLTYPDNSKVKYQYDVMGQLWVGGINFWPHVL